jgi:hypothetical protein
MAYTREPIRMSGNLRGDATKKALKEIACILEATVCG